MGLQLFFINPNYPLGMQRLPSGSDDTPTGGYQTAKELSQLTNTDGTASIVKVKPHDFTVRHLSPDLTM